MTMHKYYNVIDVTILLLHGFKLERVDCMAKFGFKILIRSILKVNYINGSNPILRLLVCFQNSHGALFGTFIVVVLIIEYKWHFLIT